MVMILGGAMAACGGGEVITQPDAPTGGGADAAALPDGATGGADAAATVDARGDGGTAGPDARVDAGGPGADARVVDAGAPGPDAAPGNDAGPIMSLVEVRPAAASRTVTTVLAILGFNIASGASVKLENCDTGTVYDLTAASVIAGDGRAIAATLVADPTREQGLYTVRVTNPGGGSDVLACAVRVSAALPPTVSAVTPGSAFAGVSSDAVLSDELVAVTGSGFQATPVVRWTSVDGKRSFEAQVTSFITPTQITAVVPTESRGMPVGSYKVTVQNPDLLEGTWAGTFEVTGNPPPRITAFDPVRVENGSCTSTAVTLTGTGFADTATPAYVAPGGSGCGGGVLDANGNRLCPMTVVARGAGTLTVRFSSCPGTGPWPLAVRNPDGQLGYAYALEVTPSADGHLNQSDFMTLASTLVTPRWKHAAAFGFDDFAHSFIYVSGGQDKLRNVLGSVEISELDIFGTPGPFARVQQFASKASPRVDNDLARAREGHTLLRAGRGLWAIGGSTEATDTLDLVTGSRSVEHAVILGYDEMPRAQTPVEQPGGGLPDGLWYYRVSALGAWGEGLGSLEQAVRTHGGPVRVCWGAPAGASGFNVYRSLGSDGRAGTTALVAADVKGGCFTDDGAGVLAPAPGRLRGTVTAGTRGAGTFTYRVAAVVGARETYASYAAAIVVTAGDVQGGKGAVTLTWDAVAGASAYRLYRLDGQAFRRLATGTLTDTSIEDDGLAFGDGAPVPEIATLPPGSLSRWHELGATQFLTVARDGVDGVTVRLQPAGANDPVARLIVAGGREDNDKAASYLATAESIAVGPDGQLVGEWEEETAVFDTARAFYALLTTQDRNVTPFPPPPTEPPCVDQDGDTFPACSCAPVGTSCDCDDTDPGTNPGEDEICGDDIDQDCDGDDPTCACTTDADGDDVISLSLCAGPDCCDSGSEGGLGCSVAAAGGIHPDAVEICGDKIDQNCDGIDPACQCTIDADTDGHRTLACGGDDCCDSGTEVTLGCTAGTAGGIFPGNAEICGDGIDQDCDGLDPGCECQVADLDGDGHNSLACGGDDCCDLGEELVLGCDPSTADGIFPGNAEICDDAIDQNCNGTDLICKVPGSIPSGKLARRPAVAGDEPVYLVAVQGDGGLTRGGSSTVASGLLDFEACGVDMATGHLDCGSTWVVQASGLEPSRAGIGLDALLYFDFMFPFPAAKTETVTAAGSTRDLASSSIGRFEVNDPATVVNDHIIGANTSGSTKFLVNRSHYQMLRLMSYLYVIGGMTDAGPSGTVERHLQ